MEEKIIQNLQATGWKSPFLYNGKNYTVDGNFDASGDKFILNISGTVKQEENYKGSFSAHRAPDGELHYDFSNIADIIHAVEIITDIRGAVEGVQRELNESE